MGVFFAIFSFLLLNTEAQIDCIQLAQKVGRSKLFQPQDPIQVIESPESTPEKIENIIPLDFWSKIQKFHHDHRNEDWYQDGIGDQLTPAPWLVYSDRAQFTLESGHFLFVAEPKNYSIHPLFEEGNRRNLLPAAPHENGNFLPPSDTVHFWMVRPIAVVSPKDAPYLIAEYFHQLARRKAHLEVLTQFGQGMHFKHQHISRQQRVLGKEFYKIYVERRAYFIRAKIHSELVGRDLYSQYAELCYEHLLKVSGSQTLQMLNLGPENLFQF